MGGDDYAELIAIICFKIAFRVQLMKISTWISKKARQILEKFFHSNKRRFFFAFLMKFANGIEISNRKKNSIQLNIFCRTLANPTKT